MTKRTLSDQETQLVRPIANIAEFWTHWHISLSKWLTDYVYIPLGGSRPPASVPGRIVSTLATFVAVNAGWAFFCMDLHTALFSFGVFWEWPDGQALVVS